MPSKTTSKTKPQPPAKRWTAAAVQSEAEAEALAAVINAAEDVNRTQPHGRGCKSMQTGAAGCDCPPRAAWLQLRRALTQLRAARKAAQDNAAQS